MGSEQSYKGQDSGVSQLKSGLYRRCQTREKRQRHSPIKGNIGVVTGKASNRKGRLKK